MCIGYVCIAAQCIFLFAGENVFAYYVLACKSAVHSASHVSHRGMIMIMHACPTTLVMFYTTTLYVLCIVCAGACIEAVTQIADSAKEFA